MDASEQINELAAALAKAQGAITPAKFDGQNPHLKNRYTTLAAVWDVIRKPLSENGLAVVQVVATEVDGMFLLTRLMHSSGQYIQAVYPITAGDSRGVSSAQAVGSALTYARRYSLTALVGVVSDDDDDGNSAAAPQPARQVEQRRQQSPPEQRHPAQPAPATNGQQAQPAAERTTASVAQPWQQEVRPWSIDNVIGALRYAAEHAKNEAPADGTWGALIGLLDSAPFDTMARHTLLRSVFGVDSSKDLTGKQRYALLRWANVTKSGPEKSDPWVMDGNAIEEYRHIVGLDIETTDEDAWAAIDAAGVTQEQAPF